MGSVSPLALKPEPLVFDFERVILRVLWLVMVAYCWARLPTGTTPKLMLFGAAERSPLP
jgi:hypothetical protein